MTVTVRGALAVVAFAATGLSIAAGAHAAPAVPERELQITRVDVTAAPQVSVEVGLPATAAGAEIGAGSFVVLDQGQPVDVEVEVMPASNLEVVLVIDISGSMNEGAAIDAAKGAARRFLEVLPVETKVGIVTFADQPALVSPLTTDRVLLLAAIDGLSAGGETALYDAMTFVPTLFSGSTSDRQVVLLSDGGDTVSATTFDAALAAMTGIRTNVIELVSSEANHQALEQLAGQAGGSVSSVSDPGALEGLFRGVADMLIHRYLLTFTSVSSGPTALTITAATPEASFTGAIEVQLPAAPVTTVAPTTVPVTTAAAVVTVAPPAPTEPVDTQAPAAAAPSSPEPGRGPRTGLLALGAGAVFVALTLLVLSALPNRRQPRSQILPAASIMPAAAAKAGVGAITDRLTGAADRLLERGGRRRGLANALDVAGVSLRPAEYVVLAAVGGVVLMLLLFAMIGPIGLLLGMVVTPVIARLVVSWRAKRRRRAFAEQLPDVLQLMVSSLRAGYALPQALDAATTQSADPARAELRRVLFEIRVGRDPTTALDAAARRMESRDFSWVVSAIQINRELGGELAGVLEKVTETIRERKRLARQIDTLTAEGRLSAYVLTALPLVLAAFIGLTNPGFFDPFAESPGPLLVGVGVVLLITGWLWMRRVIRSQL